MMRLLVIWWLVKRMDRLLANDRFAGHWHLAVTALTVVEAVGECTYHLGGYFSHQRALTTGEPSPCRHSPRRSDV